MHFVELCFVFIMLLAGHGARQYSSSLEYAYGDSPDAALRDCPQKCRCIALGYLGLQGLGQNWQSDEAWRADAPARIDDLEGRDVVCTGLGRVPWPLPEGRFNINRCYSTATNRCHNNKSGITP